MSVDIDVPEAVRRKAEALGAPGRRWVDGLGVMLAELEHEWQVELVSVLAGGSAALVVTARSADGAAVVVKVAMPDGLVGNGSFAAEVAALRLAAGRSYVRPLRVDDGRRALLLERLGRPLRELDLPVEAQIDVVASTVREGWRPVPSTARLRTGAQQADFLGPFIADTWAELDRPCPADTIAEAQRFLDARRVAFDRRTAVLVHGDAHPANILEAPGGVAGTFRSRRHGVRAGARPRVRAA